MTSAEELLSVARVWLAAGRSPLLVGAPGTGKTRSARELSLEFTGHSPVVVVGRGDLAGRELLYEIVPSPSGADVYPGALLISLIASWIRLMLAQPPVWLLVDELNRMNPEVGLGPLFLGLDPEQRHWAPAAPWWVVDSATQHLGDVATAAGLEIDEAIELLKTVSRRLREAGYAGLPFPASWRVIATMNLADRAHLHRVGFALLRRMPLVIYPSVFRSYEPIIKDPKSVFKDGAKDVDIDKIKAGVEEYCRQALAEMRAVPRHVRLGVVRADPPVYITRQRGDLEYLAKNALEVYGEGLSLLWLLAREAHGLGVEIGPSLFVDACRAAIAGHDQGLRPEVYADMVVAGLLLPQVSQAIPRARMELVIGAASATYDRLQKLLALATEALGNESMTAWYAEAVRLELGA